MSESDETESSAAESIFDRGAQSLASSALVCALGAVFAPPIVAGLAFGWANHEAHSDPHGGIAFGFLALLVSGATELLFLIGALIACVIGATAAGLRGSRTAYVALAALLLTLGAPVLHYLMFVVVTLLIG